MARKILNQKKRQTLALARRERELAKWNAAHVAVPENPDMVAFVARKVAIAKADVDNLHKKGVK